jgi:hypothetical protein
MAQWPTTIRLGEDLKLLVTDSQGNDLIKARLSLHSTEIDTRFLADW